VRLKKQIVGGGDIILLRGQQRLRGLYEKSFIGRSLGRTDFVRSQKRLGYRGARDWVGVTRGCGGRWGNRKHYSGEI